MPKTVTLRLDDVSYDLIKNHAIADNRPLSNYIETATLKFIEEVDYADDFEMENILNDEKLIRSLKKGSSDAANRRGLFIWISIEFLKLIIILGIMKKLEEEINYLLIKS